MDTVAPIYVTVKKHPKAELWKALVVSSRGTQPIPRNHSPRRGQAELAAMAYAVELGVEYVAPVEVVP